MDDLDYASMNVVVIDDDVMLLRSIAAALREYKFSVITFDDPTKGIDWIRENGADIVISDIRMPQCDGFQVLEEVKKSDPQCDLIFITAHSQVDLAIRALREGATDFFEKPFSGDVLRAAIERTTRFRVLAQQRKLLSERVQTLSGELMYRDRHIMIGQSDAMKAIAEQIIDVADSAATVLIVGESGTGKELVASAIHQSSTRRDRPFLTLNCASIPEDLFESEMFGHRRGSFTGAVESRTGYVEACAGGTLFLDEIGDLPLPSQAKILRLLEQRTYLPVGEREEREADIRMVAATNQTLETLVKDRTFREDLYYRLCVCVINLPPLRERKSDIPILTVYFALQFAAEMGKAIDGIEDQALQALVACDFPGNVRELRNIIESSIIHCRHGGKLRKDDLPSLASLGEAAAAADTGDWPIETIRFEDVERRLYREALARTNNNVSAAARLLGLSRGKLRRRLSDLGL